MLRSHLARWHLAWPLPAICGWGLAWLVVAAAPAEGLPAAAAPLAGLAVGLACSLLGDTRWRRIFIAAGFPLSWSISHWGAQVPSLVWLLPCAVLALLYPRHAWRDAPWFPTPAGALSALPQHIQLSPGATVLDAGCGLGHGLRELHRAYPQTRLEGLEWSWPLRWAAALACPWARVRRADIWNADWSGYALVYLFQRPESMPLAYAKACAELASGAWLVSLEFAVPDVEPTWVVTAAAQRKVWAYRIPPRPTGTRPR